MLPVEVAGVKQAVARLEEIQGRNKARHLLTIQGIQFQVHIDDTFFF